MDIAEFRTLMGAEPLDLSALATWLDAADPETRLAAIRSLNKKQQRRLYHSAGNGTKLTIEHFVPNGTETLVEVIHDGKNSLGVFSEFQKRFCRIPGDDTRLAGYNEGSLRWAIGPGYFVAYDRPEEGEVWIDYRLLPEHKAADWPEIQPQSVRLGRFVYSGMIDVLRPVSTHVTIGRAIIGGKESENYFALCRQENG